MGFDTAIARMQRKFRIITTTTSITSTTTSTKNPIKSEADPELTRPPICRREIIPCDMLNNTTTTTTAIDPTSLPTSTTTTSEEKLNERRRARRKAKSDAAAGKLRAPKLSHRSRVIESGASLLQVMENVPIRYRGHDAQRVYSTAEDGVSLGTLYRGVSNAEAVILLIRDNGGAIFGSFSACGYKPDIGGRYSGSGEAFVFTVSPTANVYKWCRRNNFYQLCTTDSIGIGGGGAFALFLDNMLLRGSSDRSDTFGNVCLASASQFEAVVVEAYKLVVPARLIVG